MLFILSTTVQTGILRPFADDGKKKTSQPSTLVDEGETVKL